MQSNPESSHQKKLNLWSSLAMESCFGDRVYVAIYSDNHRVSVFSTEGKFLKSYGCKGEAKALPIALLTLSEQISYTDFFPLRTQNVFGAGIRRLQQNVCGCDWWHRGAEKQMLSMQLLWKQLGDGWCASVHDMKENFAEAVTGSSYLGCHQKAHQRNQDRREAHL